MLGFVHRCSTMYPQQAARLHGALLGGGSQRLGALLRPSVCATASQRQYTLLNRLKELAKPQVEREATELDVVNFKSSRLGMSSLLTRSDEDLGGFSTVNLDLHDAQTQPYARFHGEISLDLPEDRPEIVRLGYAMFRTKDLPPTLLGLGAPAFHDWSAYGQLSLRVRGDNRKYFINIQGDTPYPTDLYQHRLFLRTPGEWETVTVSFANFILTNGGVIQQQERLDTAGVKSVGVGLIDGQYGPYQLDVAWIKVHNGEEAAERAEAESVEPAAPSESLAGASSLGASPLGEAPRAEREGTSQEVKTPGKRLSVDD